jgi:hypothetical protein
LIVVIALAAIGCTRAPSQPAEDVITVTPIVAGTQDGTKTVAGCHSKLTGYVLVNNSDYDVHVSEVDLWTDRSNPSEAAKTVGRGATVEHTFKPYALLIPGCRSETEPDRSRVLQAEYVGN